MSAIAEPTQPTAIHRGEDELPFVTLPDGLGKLQLLQADLANGVWVVRNLFPPGAAVQSTSTRAPCTRSRSGGAGDTWSTRTS
jgi:hypothetical protein